MSVVEELAPWLPHVEGMAEGAYCVDRTRRILAWNGAAERITGYTRDEALGKRCWHNLLRHVDDQGRQLCRGYCPIVNAMDDGAPREAAVYLHHRDGHRVAVQVLARPLRDEAGAVVGALETFVPLDCAALADEAPALAVDRDPLTGLPGRETALLRLERWLDALSRGGRKFGLVMLRIDSRERVVGRFGRETYEAIVRAIAATITHAIHAGDAAARVEEDTFLVLVPDASTRDIAAQAHRLRFLVEQTFLVRDHRLVRVGVSSAAALGLLGEKPPGLLERALAELN